MNKASLEGKLSKIDGHLSLLEEHYNEFKLQYNKLSVEEILNQRAVKMTIQIPYDKSLFDNVPIADKVLSDFLFVTRCKGDLEENK